MSLQSGTGTLNNHTATLTFNKEQKNDITLSTANTFVDENIVLTTKVTKAVLTTTSGDTDHKTFTMQIPNGSATDILLVFTTDTSGNTVVTGSNAST